MNPFSILLVDDDEIERIKFKKVCNDINITCTIEEANNGKKAMAILKEHKNFSIIVLDLQMPEMNGLELLEQLKKNEALYGIPIIIMSNSEDTSELRKCYQLGIAGYFTKPAKYSDYAKKVKSLLKYWTQNEFIN
ncbi:response regulator [uncultured Polaribacter sp.]|uniref:response regulator n=1 Tax=uncultured Polaribacter sp. TaxID=174711 RepID=UPI002621E1B3|nr:response regulator [uncultured Polaribacter sp.]